jgi:hypothetical protein
MSFADMDRERQLATVRTLGQNRQENALIREHVKRVMERRLHSQPSGRSMPPSDAALRKPN